VIGDFQEALVALALDAGTRERFLRGAPGALAPFRLDDRELSMLRAIEPVALERCARGLLDKRWEELRRIVPLSARATPALARLYRGFLARHPAPVRDGVLSPGHAEALRALDALERALRADPGAAPWAPDLLGFEVFAACSRADGLVRGGRGAYALHEIAAEIRDGRVPFDADPAPHAYRFDRAGVRHRRLA
jgi:hypothetical protein